MKKAFTLIELLVVIAIIAILAAILFPVFAQAKEAAKLTKALAQMKQLGTSLMIYSSDNDDYLVPASMRTTNPADLPQIWPVALTPYVKNADIFVSPAATNSAMATGWTTRQNQSIGYSDATGVDPLSTAVEGSATPGTEGFTGAANFGQAEESASTGLIATTPNSVAGKERGYVFNPYNGATPTTYATPAENYKFGLPLVSDVNVTTTVAKMNPLTPCPTSGAKFDCTAKSAGQLKTIYARFRSTGQGEGMTPVIFADGHAKSFSSNAINTFGKIIWRFR